MICAHVGRVQLIADPLEADSVSQTLRVNSAACAVRVHLNHGRTDFFLLFASVGRASDRNIELAVWPKGERARQVPAAILVAQTVIWKSCEHLRLACGRVVAVAIAIADQTVRQRNVNPTLPA